MRIAIYVQARNLTSGFLCLKPTHIQAYWNGLIDSIDVFSEDKTFLESYYGDGLLRLILSCKDFPHQTDKYFLAKRWNMG